MAGVSTSISNCDNQHCSIPVRRGKGGTAPLPRDRCGEGFPRGVCSLPYHLCERQKSRADNKVTRERQRETEMNGWYIGANAMTIVDPVLFGIEGRLGLVVTYDV